jgi:hypothetical protein
VVSNWKKIFLEKGWRVFETEKALLEKDKKIEDK